MLKTEQRNPKTTHIDQMDAQDIVEIMNEENRVAVDAVEAALPQVARAIDAITKGFSAGGRLFYVGAGTSGGLGILDAAECPPTFGVPDGKVVGLLAGGDITNLADNSEDQDGMGEADLKGHSLCQNDIVVGISAAGGAAYVLGALRYAAALGCTTVGITSNPGSPLDQAADISICTDTGPEVVTGSTRLKAGTAQKLVLNMLSTGAMIRSGYVYENLMINLQPSNIKLRQRMIGIVQDVAGVSAPEAEARLEAAEWNIRAAVQ